MEQLPAHHSNKQTNKQLPGTNPTPTKPPTTTKHQTNKSCYICMNALKDLKILIVKNGPKIRFKSNVGTEVNIENKTVSDSRLVLWAPTHMTLGLGPHNCKEWHCSLVNTSSFVSCILYPAFLLAVPTDLLEQYTFYIAV